MVTSKHTGSQKELGIIDRVNFKEKNIRTTCRSFYLWLRPAEGFDVMKPFTAVVLLRRCQWCDYTHVITPLDGSVGVKYGGKNVL